MHYLYLDNIRGFQDTIIPLEDINFFVGENSTGKTSVMSLLSILSDPNFWMSSGPSLFNLGDTKIGNFQDLVSAKSNNKKYFRVGMYFSNKKDSDDAYLITFKETEGMPAFSRYSFENENQLLDVIFDSKTIRYRIGNTTIKKNSGLDDVKIWFEDIINGYEEMKRNYKVIKPPTSNRLRRSLGVLNAHFFIEKATLRDKRSSIISYNWAMPYKRIAWLAPIRTKPRRTYDEYNLEYSSEGEHTPYLIKRYFRKKSEKKKFLNFVNNFGEESGLFTTIGIKSFGRTITSPFELDIDLNGSYFKIVNVGYGVSQVLPVIVELFAQAKDTCYMIQQPEIHLHPKAQAAIGKLFYDLHRLENKCFVVETHSDYVVDSFRLRYREKNNKKNKPSAQILYFERTSEGNQVFTIKIDNNGELPEDQPKGYREFFLDEQMKMIGY